MYDTYVINADELAKEMYKNGTEYYNSIEKEFYHFLLNKGIKVKIESNGVLDDISSKN